MEDLELVIMKFVFLLVAVVTTGSRVAAAPCTGKDLTRVDDEDGELVVEATVDLIQRVFPPDNDFLRRLAYVESRDGTIKCDTSDRSALSVTSARSDDQTDNCGGIWRVCAKQLRMTQEDESLMNHRAGILSNLKIDWLDVTMSDLQAPFYSGLAARLIIAKLEPVPQSDEIEMQGEYWNKTYCASKVLGAECSSSCSNINKDDFTDLVNELLDQEIKDCFIRGLELYFVLDASGSIGEENFERVRNFTSEIAGSFEIGPQGTQVGVIIYSQTAAFVFDLDDNSNRDDLLFNISQIPYISGGTATGDALYLLATEAFTPERGVRNSSFGLPHVGIVLTDGKSNRGIAVDVAAPLVHAQDIQTIVVGVGDNINHMELLVIADYDNSSVYDVDSFQTQQLNNLQKIIALSSCKAVDILRAGEVVEAISVKEGVNSFFEVNITSEGITVFLDVTEGASVIYYSCYIGKPSKAYHDGCLATDNSTQTYIPSCVTNLKEKRQENSGSSKLFLTIETLLENNTFKVNFVIGDQSSPIAPSGPPQSISVIAIDHQSFHAEWDPPKIYHQNGDILQYVVSVTTVDSGETVVFNSTETNLLVENLRSLAKYSVAVSAVNADGMGPFSDPSTVETHGGSGIPIWSIVIIVFAGLLLLMTGTLSAYFCIFYHAK